MNKTKLAILLILILLLCSCGEKGTLHEYEEFIDYVDYMDCEYSKLCELKDKYEVISDEKGVDERNKETRTLTFKIKNTDLKFEVTSASLCTSNFDGSCLEHTYTLTDNYQYEASKYYYEQLNKKLNYNNELCKTNYNDESYCNGDFKINTTSDLAFAIDYMNQYLDIVNNLEFKFVNVRQTYFTLVFDEDNNKSLYIKLDHNDKKYTYNFENKYKPSDNSIETYINNYLSENKIVVVTSITNE